MSKRPQRNARKRAQEPTRGNGWLAGGLLLVVGLGTAAHLGYQYLSQPGRLPLRVVEINGDFHHLAPAAIEAQVAGAIDGGFFTVDMQRVRNAVRGMPWVAEVSVRRVWPDMLRMHVTEQVALARWGEDALVNLHGEVFRPQPMIDSQELPRLDGGPQDAPEVVNLYLLMRSALVNSELTLQEMQLNRRGEWSVTFGNGLSVMFGGGDVVPRMRDFLKVYPQLRAQASREPERIDMRYEHGFAVRWKTEAVPEGGVLSALAGEVDG
jgi:cell division protein FtsQ